MKHNEPLLTAKELAAAMKVALRSVRAWTAAGMTHIPAGRLKRYRLSECITWLRKRDAQTRAKRQELARRTAGLHVSRQEQMGRQVELDRRLREALVLAEKQKETTQWN